MLSWHLASVASTVSVKLKALHLLLSEEEPWSLICVSQSMTTLEKQALTIEGPTVCILFTPFCIRKTFSQEYNYGRCLTALIVAWFSRNQVLLRKEEYRCSYDCNKSHPFALQLVSVATLKVNFHFKNNVLYNIWSWFVWMSPCVLTSEYEPGFKGRFTP